MLYVEKYSPVYTGIIDEGIPNKFSIDHHSLDSSNTQTAGKTAATTRTTGF